MDEEMRKDVDSIYGSIVMSKKLREQSRVEWSSGRMVAMSKDGQRRGKESLDR